MKNRTSKPKSLRRIPRAPYVRADDDAAVAITRRILARLEPGFYELRKLKESFEYGIEDAVRFALGMATSPEMDEIITRMRETVINVHGGKEP